MLRQVHPTVPQRAGAAAALAIALLILSPSYAEQRANCKPLYPPYTFNVDDAQYVSDPYVEGSWEGRMLASKFQNGDDSLEMLRLSINPGHGQLPHRHLEADEWTYVLSGAGAYTYWAFEDVAPVELKITPGEVNGSSPTSQPHNC